MFSVVLPFYNEEECIEEVVRSLVKQCRKKKLPVKLILVNNGSSDQTGKIIKKLQAKYKEITGVAVAKNRGYGYGIRRGLEICDSKYLGYMCGDGQTDTQDVIKVIKALQNNPELDICKVVRTQRHDGVMRQITTFLYNLLFTLAFFIPAKDVNGTPKIFKHSAYKKLKLTSDDWFIDAELIIKAKIYNLKMLEIPTKFYPRETGISYVSQSTIIEFLVNMLRYRFKLPLKATLKTHEQFN